MNGPLTGILLAAGLGRRFGGNKITLRLSDGRAVGLASAASLSGAVDRIFVVVNALGGDTDQLFREAGLTTVCAADASSGMAHSLVRGITHSLDSGGWLIALADMPFVNQSTIAAVAAELRLGAPIALPRYAGKFGHPVGFSARFSPELLALRGDEGARQIIQRHVSLVHYVDTDDEGVIRDIDRPQDVPRALPPG